MHPSARILSWLTLVITTQALSGLGCAVGLVIFLTQGKTTLAHWWKLLRRSRILLLSLWLILAYSLPGDTWRDHFWLPSHPGITEANLHAARLCLLLATLAWLLTRVLHHQLVAGLWYLLRPLQAIGVQVDRIVVRLALVLEYLEHHPPKAHWRELLNTAPPLMPSEKTLTLVLPPWQNKDTCYLALSLGLALLLWRL